MRTGFAKIDITPQVGVPLCGFGPFLNRYSIGVRDRLWARAMAVEHDGRRGVVVSCDLIAVVAEDTQKVREFVRESTGLSDDALMISCSHTHSGPDTWRGLIGWGGGDPPYMELLPGRVARAAIEVALADLGLTGRCRVRDLWARRDLGEDDGTVRASLAAHDAVLYRASPRSNARGV